MAILRHLLIAAMAATAACGIGRPEVLEPPPPPTMRRPAPATRLRVRNVGEVPLRQFIVSFRGVAVPFGDIEPGATTAYQSVPTGIYRYAAYRYMWNGQMLTVPVSDWHSETPLPIGAYTYAIRVEPYANAVNIRSVEVLRDP